MNLYQQLDGNIKSGENAVLKPILSCLQGIYRQVVAGELE